MISCDLGSRPERSGSRSRSRGIRASLLSGPGSALPPHTPRDNAGPRSVGGRRQGSHARTSERPSLADQIALDLGPGAPWTGAGRSPSAGRQSAWRTSRAPGLPRTGSTPVRPWWRRPSGAGRRQRRAPTAPSRTSGGSGRPGSGRAPPDRSAVCRLPRPARLTEARWVRRLDQGRLQRGSRRDTAPRWSGQHPDTVQCWIRRGAAGHSQTSQSEARTSHSANSHVLWREQQDIVSLLRNNQMRGEPDGRHGHGSQSWF